MSDAVTFTGLDFSYGPDPVLRGVSLAIPEGDFVSVVGPNGSGKTTLLKLALGLLKPDRGEVAVFGQPAGRARRRVGYVPQHPRLDPMFPVSALDVALMGRLGRTPGPGPWRAADREAALAALAEVGLADLAPRHFAALSGGQKQRVLIARALAGGPDLLLLDEPTAGLDAHVEEGFYRLLQDLNRRLTIVMVSHDLGFVSAFVKSVVCVGRDVVVHPTSAVTGQVIADLYGSDVRLVRHDHRCSEEGHHA
ncbi:MAG TPA: ATP-binding cassette domain-containing protein [Candidatus Krumholzibacteria bacterium]|nr:ATP-binding cassette domain-containing protein [Candidatus Krumholzibacteria bacterium]